MTKRLTQEERDARLKKASEELAAAHDAYREAKKKHRYAEKHRYPRVPKPAETTLALELIDIGYKALARELHPDLGGSTNEMVRLNQARERLKAHA